MHVVGRGDHGSRQRLQRIDTRESARLASRRRMEAQGHRGLDGRPCRGSASVEAVRGKGRVASGQGSLAPG
jgi:hypothetical protein